MKHEIKSCPTYHGYSVSSTSQVYSHRKRRKALGQRGGSEAYIDNSYAKEMSPQKTKKGYLTVGIVIGETSRPIGVHQLVADAFHGPCPKGLQVRHLDGNPTNNIPDNLQYGTAFENAADRQAHGHYFSGQKHSNAKITDAQAAEIRLLRTQKIKVKELAVKFGVGVSTIEDIIYNKSFKVLSTTGKPEVNTPTVEQQHASMNC